MENINLHEAFSSAPKAYGRIVELSLELACTYFKQAPYYQLLCFACLNRILYLICKNTHIRVLTVTEQTKLAAQKSRFRHILDYIDDNFREKLSLEKIADEVGMSATYLSHLFRESLSMTFQEYVNQLRFNYAVTLIKSTDYNISDICLASGFSDPRYFTRPFVKQFGCTPTEYQKKRTLPVKNAGKKASSNWTQEFMEPKESLAVLKQYIKSQDCRFFSAG
jgi:AraC-like DNA-binding protein